MTFVCKALYAIMLAIFLLCLSPIVSSSQFNITYNPTDALEVYMDSYESLNVTMTCTSCADNDVWAAEAFIKDKHIADIHNASELVLNIQNRWTKSGLIVFRGKFLGRTHLSWTMVDNSGHSDPLQLLDHHDVNCLRPNTAWDVLFTVVVSILVAINTTAYACSLDISIVKEHLKKPIGVAIGFVCQYGFMPLAAFGLSRAFSLRDSLTFGLICYGASPGSGASNMWTILLRGDLNLSVSMTFVGLTSSLAMTSLWIFTLGSRYVDADVVLPYENIVMTLASLLITIFIGLTVKRFRPNIAKKMTKIIKPMSGIIILYILTFGIYTNLYVFKLMDSWQVTLSAMLVSYVGYIIAFLAAVAFKRSWKETRTIMIETGIQNGAIAILVCRYSLPQPDGDLATVAPVTAMMTSSLPLLVCLMIQCIYRKCQGKAMFASTKSPTENIIEEERDQSGLQEVDSYLKSLLVPNESNMSPATPNRSPGSNDSQITDHHIETAMKKSVDSNKKNNSIRGAALAEPHPPAPKAGLEFESLV